MRFNEVLHFLDVELPEEEESDDDFDGYVDEDREEDEEAPGEEDHDLKEMDQNGSDRDKHGNIPKN